jgi:hypothetical protein
MRKLTYLSAIVLLYTFSSCGGSATCDCVDLSLEIVKEVTQFNLYPWPFDLIFGRQLHCLYLLKKKRDE